MTTDIEMAVLAAVQGYAREHRFSSYRGTVEQAARQFKLAPDEIRLLEKPALQMALHGYGIELWFSRIDGGVRFVTTRYCRQRHPSEPGCCIYCGLPEHERDLVPARDEHGAIEPNQLIHLRCRRARHREILRRKAENERR